jgi:intracellular sulfur oxidation DsrE/DsrF family protein
VTNETGWLNRRRFFQSLGSSALSLSVGDASRAAVEIPQGQKTSSSGRPLDGWDDSWTRQVVGKRSAVVDTVNVNAGLGLSDAEGLIQSYKQFLGLSENAIGIVVIFRHQAIPMVLADIVWREFQLGAFLGLKDPSRGDLALRNPFLKVNPDDKYAMITPPASIKRLRTRGVVFIGCNRSLRGFATVLGGRERADPAKVYERLASNIVPGIRILPNGIFALVRAQELGCAYLPSLYPTPPHS